ncbi:hypothetical protein WG66_000279 [Moniliophthora roreri]|nr:hypothetical protein WG66_000279 [Moniliophthora roreri]
MSALHGVPSSSLPPCQTSFSGNYLKVLFLKTCPKRAPTLLSGSEHSSMCSSYRIWNAQTFFGQPTNVCFTDFF